MFWQTDRLSYLLRGRFGPKNVSFLSEAALLSTLFSLSSCPKQLALGFLTSLRINQVFLAFFVFIHFVLFFTIINILWSCGMKRRESLAKEINFWNSKQNPSIHYLCRRQISNDSRRFIFTKILNFKERNYLHHK